MKIRNVGQCSFVHGRGVLPPGHTHDVEEIEGRKLLANYSGELLDVSPPAPIVEPVIEPPVEPEPAPVMEEAEIEEAPKPSPKKGRR